MIYQDLFEDGMLNRRRGKIAYLRRTLLWQSNKTGQRYFVVFEFIIGQDFR